MHRSAFIALFLFVSQTALALEIEGTRYAPQVEVAGKTLHLVGGGIREATFLQIDVYTGAFYAEHAGCDFQRMVTADEVKMLRMDFVRDVPGKKMASNMRDNFKKQSPRGASGDLRVRIESFLKVFTNNVKEGDAIEVRYVPGKGTAVRINGKAVGAPVQGHDFMKVLWRIWFSKDTCCPHLYEALKDSCGK
jgi:Chalcone isomerase-like